MAKASLVITTYHAKIFLSFSVQTFKYMYIYFSPSYHSLIVTPCSSWLTNSDIQFLHNIRHCFCNVPSFHHNIGEVFSAYWTPNIELLKQIFDLPLIVFFSPCDQCPIEIESDSQLNTPGELNSRELVTSSIPGADCPDLGGGAYRQIQSFSLIPHGHSIGTRLISTIRKYIHFFGEFKDLEIEFDSESQFTIIQISYTLGSLIAHVHKLVNSIQEEGLGTCWTKLKTGRTKEGEHDVSCSCVQNVADESQEAKSSHRYICPWKVKSEAPLFHTFCFWNLVGVIVNFEFKWTSLTLGISNASTLWVQMNVFDCAPSDLNALTFYTWMHLTVNFQTYTTLQVHVSIFDSNNTPPPLPTKKPKLKYNELKYSHFRFIQSSNLQAWSLWVHILVYLYELYTVNFLVNLYLHIQDTKLFIFYMDTLVFYTQFVHFLYGYTYFTLKDLAVCVFRLIDKKSSSCKPHEWSSNNLHTYVYFQFLYLQCM